MQIKMIFILLNIKEINLLNQSSDRALCKAYEIRIADFVSTGI